MTPIVHLSPLWWAPIALLVALAVYGVAAWLIERARTRRMNREFPVSQWEPGTWRPPPENAAPGGTEGTPGAA